MISYIELFVLIVVCLAFVVSIFFTTSWDLKEHKRKMEELDLRFEKADIELKQVLNK